MPQVFALKKWKFLINRDVQAARAGGLKGKIMSSSLELEMSIKHTSVKSSWQLDDFGVWERSLNLTYTFGTNYHTDKWEKNKKINREDNEV